MVTKTKGENPNEYESMGSDETAEKDETIAQTTGMHRPGPGSNFYALASVGLACHAHETVDSEEGDELDVDC